MPEPHEEKVRSPEADARIAVGAVWLVAVGFIVIGILSSGLDAAWELIRQDWRSIITAMGAAIVASMFVDSVMTEAQRRWTSEGWSPFTVLLLILTVVAILVGLGLLGVALDLVGGGLASRV